MASGNFSFSKKIPGYCNSTFHLLFTEMELMFDALRLMDCKIQKDAFVLKMADLELKVNALKSQRNEELRQRDERKYDQMGYALTTLMQDRVRVHERIAEIENEINRILAKNPSGIWRR